MDIRNASNPRDFKKYDTARIRDEFLVTDLFCCDEIKMTYSHIDRIIVAGAKPVKNTLKLEVGKELGVSYFLERRELGVINVGGEGIISVDGVDYQMKHRDGIYVGMGSKDVTFKSVDQSNPAKFYINSAPAHATYPITKVDVASANKIPMGSAEQCNKRIINQFLHPAVMKTCQLTMGMTVLEVGSNWNTMPCHTHDRRMEVYFYFDLDDNSSVIHMMGEPNETRHVVMQNEQAVISPSWSIHSGVGTKNYTFIWGMVGENQTFEDMDMVAMKDLK